MPYTLFSYEVPVLRNDSGTWIAPGWQLWHLYLIWLVITVFIYTVSAVVAIYLSKKFEFERGSLKTVFLLIVLLVIISILGNKLLPQLVLYIMEMVTSVIWL